MAATYECDLIRNLLAFEYGDKARLRAQLNDPNTRACFRSLWEEYVDEETGELLVDVIAETEAGQAAKMKAMAVGAVAGAAVASLLFLLLRGA